MNKAVAFTADSIEELAALANAAALEAGGEVVSLQVLPMTNVEDDGYWFAGMALIDAPEVVPDLPDELCWHCRKRPMLADFGVCQECWQGVLVERAAEQDTQP